MLLERTSSSTLLITTTAETANTKTTTRGAIKDGHVEKDILVVNTLYRDAPFLLDKTGHKIHQFTFKDYVDKRKIYEEISIIFKGEFWIYGGSTGYNGLSTISKIVDCEVKEVGQIRRDNREQRFSSGRGAVRNDQTIYLCFSHWMSQSCIKSNDPLGQFTLIKNRTQFHHRRTAMSSSSGKYKSITHKSGLKFIKFKTFSAYKLFR